MTERELEDQIRNELIADQKAAAAVRRTAFIQGLRDCATFLETHPAVQAPVYVVMNVFARTREDVVAHARVASWQKEYNEGWFNLRKDFGEDVRLEINADRGLVCRKVPTGTKVVPAQPERTVETYDWACDDAVLLNTEAGR